MFLYVLLQNHKGWNIRIDSPHGPNKFNKQHIHLTKKGFKGEYSWNIDGTRHDKNNFPTNEKFIESAKQIASERLGINKNRLQFITYINSKEKCTLKENDKTILSRYYVKKDFIVCFFGTDEGIIIIELHKPINI